jgi:predicted PurR-regulated permease PerM
MKIVVGMAIVAVSGLLAVYLRPIIGPLLLAAILTYLLYPLVGRFQRTSRLSWQLSANFVFLVFLILFLAFFAIAGFALIQQIQTVFDLIDGLFKNLPKIVASFPTKGITIGPYMIDLKHLDMDAFTTQVIGGIQPMLGQTGNVVGTVATSTVEFFGWMVFIFLISYFILTEYHNRSDVTVPYLDFPGYNYDLYRLSRELNRIWNSFLRGQIILVMMVALAATIMWTILGVRYALALGLLAGVARFVPYLGQWTNLLVTGLVAYFQPGNYFNLQPEYYTALILVCAMLSDAIWDQLVAPRIMGQALGLHPAAIMVMAIISTQLIGLIGLVLAAPVLASLLLLGRYVSRKMLNMDPWLEPDMDTRTIEYPWVSLGNRVKSWLKKEPSSN